jgi:bifunctional non-homologous end joining protein LigD
MTGSRTASTDIQALRRAVKAAEKELTLEVEGREVHLTNLGKIFWPEAGWRKGDLISYYVGVSPYILPHLKRRPLVMVRYPDGISGESWFHKDLPGGAPKWVQTIRVWHHAEKKDVHYVVCDDLPTLIWLAQMGTIEIHTWSATIDDVKKADVAVFDIDPQTGEFADAVDGARMVCDLLDELDLEYYVKTTGKRGIHVFLPLKPKDPHSDVRDFVHEAILLLDRRHPDTFALSYVKSKRKGRLFVDYAQNSFGKTNITPYSLRATPDATVSTPIQLGRVDPHDYRLDTVVRRLGRTGDLWKDIREATAVTIGEARQRLRALPD